MPRLFNSSQRKLQWNEAWNYQRWSSPRSPWFCLVTSALLWLLTLLAFSGFREQSQIIDENRRRKLLSSDVPSVTYNSNCEMMYNVSAKHELSWETCDFEKSTGHSGAWIALYVFVTIVIFIALAIICDDFFVPSLEIISNKLGLSQDVAGATFMAAGSSAPELFSSVVAVAFDSDAGVGTIAGSAVFNLLIIISFAALFAKKVLHLDWRPLTRDASHYLIAVSVFIWMVSDSVVQIWEAAVLLALYIIYIINMVFNGKMMTCLDKQFGGCPFSCCSQQQVSPSIDPERNHQVNTISNGQSTTINNNYDSKEQLPKTTSSIEERRQRFKHDRRNSISMSFRKGSIDVISDRRNSAHSLQKIDEQAGASSHTSITHMSDVEQISQINGTSHHNHSEVMTNSIEEVEEEERMQCCCSCCPDIRGAPPVKSDKMTACKWMLLVVKWVFFILAFPFLLIFSYTIPECSKPHLQKWYMVSFIMSVAWIAALTFGMVTVVARTGCLLNIDTFVMSLVVLAAGTSIPDLLSSIIVARDGFGDMAVSNAIGSNVFDIDLGLGLPFLIRLAIAKAEPLDMYSQKERIAYCTGKMKINPHMKFGIILVGILVVAYSIIVIAKFKAGKLLGTILILFYLMFLVYAFCQEFLCNQPGLYNC